MPKKHNSQSITAGAGLESSDAWVLLAAIYAGKDASRDLIIKMGDAINHAIFTDEELDGGLTRLVREGCLINSGEIYSITPKVEEWYQDACPKRRYIFKDMERVSRFLSVRNSWG